MTNEAGWQGRFFEDFEVGAIYQHPLGRTVSESDNTWFTLLTMNTNQMHFNAEYAARSEFKKPLVVSTLVVGIAHMGGGSAIGRVGLKAFLWFVSASLVSLTLGLILVNVLHPGTGLNLPLPDAAAGSGVDRSSFDVAKFFIHIVPTSAIDAMATVMPACCAI